jgi:hypothetical protein
MYPFRRGLGGDTRNETPVLQVVAKYISEIPLKNENRSSFINFYVLLLT